VNIRPPYRYVDPVIGARTSVYVDDRGFVQISMAHASDPALVMATRIRDEALDGLIEELIAARNAIAAATPASAGEPKATSKADPESIASPDAGPTVWAGPWVALDRPAPVMREDEFGLYEAPGRRPTEGGLSNGYEVPR
jgi:hypothetical protein